MFCVAKFIEVFFDKYNKTIHFLAPHEVLHNPWNRIAVINTLVVVFLTTYSPMVPLVTIITLHHVCF